MPTSLQKLFHGALVLLGASATTFALFLVLPIMQSIGNPEASELVVRTVEAGDLPPPPPPIEDEPKQEPEPEEKPPELSEEAPPLDLAELELALNAGLGGDGISSEWLRGDVANRLQASAKGGEGGDALFSLADLDQRPRPIYQPDPSLSAKVRDRCPGSVTIVFIVDERGRVEKPIVQKSSDPVLEAPALGAVKQWRFEPGKRNGKPVRFRMRVPITFR